MHPNFKFVYELKQNKEYPNSKENGQKINKRLCFGLFSCTTVVIKLIIARARKH